MSHVRRSGGHRVTLACLGIVRPFVDTRHDDMEMEAQNTAFTSLRTCQRHCDAARWKLATIGSLLRTGFGVQSEGAASGGRAAFLQVVQKLL